MFKQIRFHAILASALFLGSCTSSKFMVSPPFTTTSAIASLSEGMTQVEVESKLGIPAFEVISHVDGGMWISYNYRVTNYIAPITNYGNGLAVAEPGEEPVSVDAPEARNIGTMQYGDWGLLYILYKDGQYTASIAETGKTQGNELEVLRSSLQNHAAESPFFLVGNRLYNKDENGVLKVMSDDGCCRGNRHGKIETRRKNQ